MLLNQSPATDHDVASTFVPHMHVLPHTYIKAQPIDKLLGYPSSTLDTAFYMEHILR